ncbi:MAG TPA: hypothetical protein VF006_33255 [Longimicrobium sp.]
MRIPRFPAAALAVMFILAACGGGADASAAKPGSIETGTPASREEVAALVQQFGLGGGEKDVAGEAFYDLAQRAAPGLLEIARDPSTRADELETVLFISSMYVKDPEIFAALRTRAQAIPDPEERELRLKLVDALSTTPGLPYPR